MSPVKGPAPLDLRAGSSRRIEIPDARIGLEIEHLSPFEMLRRERARFVLGRFA